MRKITFLGALALALSASTGAFAAPLTLVSTNPEVGDVNAKTEWWEYFETVNLEFDQPVYLADGKTVSLQYPGADAPMELDPNMMFATMDFGGVYTVIINGDEDMKYNGEYVLTVAPGTFTNEAGEAYEGGTFTWNVTGLAEGQVEEGDNTPLTITSLFIGDAEDSDETDDAGNFIVHIKKGTAYPIENGTYLEAIYETDAIEVLFNHSDKAKEVKWSIVDNTAEETVLSGWMKKLSSGVFTMTPGCIDIELYDGHEYALTFHAYNQQPSQGRVEYGEGAQVIINGLTESFSFSDARCLGFYPTPDTYEIESIEQNRITVVFDKPAYIDEDRSYIEYGWGNHGKFAEVEYDNSNRNIATLVIPTNIIANEDIRLKLVVFAYDYSDKQIEGNNGIDEESRLEFDYKCSVATAAPELVGMPRYTNTNAIRVTNPKANEYIMEGYLAYPYLTNNKGTVLAVMDKEKGFVSTKTGMDYEHHEAPFEQEFRLVKPDTDEVFSTPGTYTLVFPRGTFTFGSDSYNHYGSKKISYPVVIAEMVDVNYIAAGHHVNLGESPKGESRTFALTPAEGWKVSSLTLNGEDILDCYDHGTVTTPALEKDAEIVADMEYDGDLFISTGIDDVVSPLEISIWSEDGKLHLRGLKAGQKVALYTVNGTLVCENAIDEDGEGTYSVEAGIYVILVSENGATTAFKAINK